MSDIKIREEKMKAKRMQTPFRDFVKEICSRYGLLFNKERGQFTNHAPVPRMKLVDIKIYEEIRNGFTDLGIEYNSEKPLRDQIKTLLQTCGVPGYNLIGSVENVQFSDCIRAAKNVYLSYVSGESSSNILYSFHVKVHCNNVLNSIMVRDGCDIVYQSADVIKSYKIFYSKYIYSSNNIRFSSNMIGCSECMFCEGLSNASHCIRNQQMTSAEYQMKKEEFLSQKQSYEARYREISPITNCKGSFVIKSTNVDNGINVYQVNNGRNIANLGGGELDENIFDCCIGGTPATKDNYFCNLLGGGNNFYGCRSSYYGSNIYYSIYCDTCSYCLGCVGLKNKSFCILNKQYSKEERFILANQIFADMEKSGTLGKFFPASMNPFYSNDTFAFLVDDTFTKEEVTKEGYLRRDDEIKVDIPQDAEVVLSCHPDLDHSGEGSKRASLDSSIPQNDKAGIKTLSDFEGFDASDNRQINPEILKKVIKDEKENYYRIVPMELDFLQKYGLPLPQLHRLERIKLGFKFK